MKARHVIFDCDGVLADTEEIYFNMNRRFIQKRGGDFDLKYYERFIGLSSDLMWGELREKFSLTESVEDLIAQEKVQKSLALAEAALQPITGILEFITALRDAKITLSVASSGRRENVHLILEAIALKNSFVAIITGEDITRGKPAPDIFLKAAAASQQQPADCIVIEDSRNGTLGAKAAGMRCVGYINPQSGNQDLSAADICIASFNDIALLHFVGINA